jgi:hypothetical protein
MHPAQDLSDTIPFLVRCMDFFGRWLSPESLKELIQPRAAAALAQGVNRQVRRNPIEPSFQVHAGAGWAAGPSQEHFRGKFLCLTSIACDHCNRACNPAIVESEDRLQIRIALDNWLGLGVRQVHTVIDAQVASFVTGLCGKVTGIE